MNGDFLNEVAPRSPVLLTMPTYGGTLAAARLLGSSGVPVVVAGHQILAAARWSRYVSRFVSCPPVQEGERFIAWLTAYGERHPGHVLLPTSDETALLYASNAKLLEASFRMYQPPLESILRILDKKSLSAACQRVGLDTLPSWFPSRESELHALAAQLPYPVLIKPRTQVGRASPNKGIIVRSPNDLARSYRAIAKQARKLPGFSDLSGAGTPMIQEFAEKANEGVYSLSGFVDRDGKLIAARGATKIFQRVRSLGIGVCFESSPLREDLTEAVRRLCREVGYFGVFEVEFLCWNQKWVVIDFNPRFYHQMGFDIARGLSAPIWAYLGAYGEDSVLRSELRRAERAPDGSATVFRDRFTFWTILTAMRITGRLSAPEAARWKHWTEIHRNSVVDVAIDVRDPLPGFVHALSETKLGLAALPRFLRAIRNRASAAVPSQDRERRGEHD